MRKRCAAINTIWTPDPATGRMTYDASADDSAHKREKWGVGCDPDAVSPSEAEPPLAQDDPGLG